ncbi:MAG: hypothetical protein ACJ766_15060, partial [Thermoleophilaceae bacterium]
PVAFGLVLLVSLSIWITQWDRVILSESLGISLTAALFAAWLALVRAPNGWTVAAVLATTALWAFTRDTNALLVLLAVPCVLGWIALRGVRPGRVVLAAGLVAIFAASTASQSGPHASWARWEAPLLNVIGVRVLTNPGELHYFRDHGMPLPRPVRVLDGTLLGSRHLSPGTALDRDPRLEGFRDWVRGHGRQTLGTYLMTHPYRTFRPVVENRGPLFETDPSGYEGEGLRLAGYGAHGVPRLLPAPLATAVSADDRRAARLACRRGGGGDSPGATRIRETRLVGAGPGSGLPDSARRDRLERRANRHRAPRGPGRPHDAPWAPSADDFPDRRRPGGSA